jgi:hypothetical protein
MPVESRRTQINHGMGYAQTLRSGHRCELAVSARYCQISVRDFEKTASKWFRIELAVDATYARWVENCRSS